MTIPCAKHISVELGAVLLAKIQARCHICPECGEKWLWTGNHANDMHRAMLELDGRRYPIRATVYRVAVENPKRECVTTKCHATSCVNPALLASVSKAHIVRRSIKEGKILNAKHRLGLIVGRRSRSTRLDMEKAEVIRMSEKNNVALAAEFGVSRQTIQRVKAMQQWRPAANPFAGLLS